jgi:hypothetical protein
MEPDSCTVLTVPQDTSLPRQRAPIRTGFYQAFHSLHTHTLYQQPGLIHFNALDDCNHLQVENPQYLENTPSATASFVSYCNLPCADSLNLFQNRPIHPCKMLCAVRLPNPVKVMITRFSPKPPNVSRSIAVTYTSFQQYLPCPGVLPQHITLG